jgi:hypothetical protein
MTENTPGPAKNVKPELRTLAYYGILLSIPFLAGLAGLKFIDGYVAVSWASVIGILSGGKAVGLLNE